MSCVSLQKKVPKFQETSSDLETQLLKMGVLCENVTDPDALLESVNVKLRGAATATNFVQNIDYDAKGQRERIQYGNGSTTGYTYDEKTFRLKRLLTTRNNGADVLQDLNYTYDAVGNVTQIDDSAQQTIFFNGSVVSPSQKFEYDALYRLIKATGREHVSVNADGEPEAEGYNAAQISPQDGSAMRNYSREWEYDSVGNILSMIHKFNGSQWTRRNAYATDSNRLTSSTVGSASANFSYNAHGSMTSMPHLSAMDWDFAEKLCHVTRGTTEAYYNYDGSGIRTRKVVEKNGVVETRLYLGGFEIWRKTVNGTFETERETLHVMDDQRRIALVETLTVENGNAVANPVPVLRFQLDNHLGSASLELDDSANIISYEEYYPYGDTSYRAGRNASEVSRKRYRYTGKEKDEESGLYYHGARYYACWLGRWTAADPIGIGDGLNVYMYVHGNPVKLQDPSGGASTNSVDEGTVLPTFDDVEVIDEGDVLPTFEDIEVKGEGTYLPGDETDRLTENSTFEERQAFANRRGYKIVDPNPEEQWWVGDSENGYWHTSEQGKLVPLQDDTPDSNNVLLDNTENVSDSGNESGADFESYANGAAKATQVGFDAGGVIYNNMANVIAKRGASALDNPNLTNEMSKNVQKNILENYKAARATSKFLGKANILLSIGLGAIESAEYAYQGKSCHALWNGIVSVGAISAGLLLGPGITTVTAMIALSIGIALVASAFSFIGNNILDSME